MSGYVITRDREEAPNKMLQFFARSVVCELSKFLFWAANAEKTAVS
jgi:hypothetical protein